MLSVHAGGVGTIGQGLRSRRPQLVVPFAHDQFDNARRITARGVGGTVSRRRLTPRKLAGAIERLLHDDHVFLSAEAVGDRVRAEDGVARACDAMERVLAGSNRA